MTIYKTLRSVTLLLALGLCPGCPEPPATMDGGADLAPQADLRPELSGLFHRTQDGARETFLFQRDGRFSYEGPEERLEGTYQIAEGKLTLEFLAEGVRNQVITPVHVGARHLLVGTFVPQGAPGVPSGVIGTWSLKVTQIKKDPAGKEVGREEIDETLRLEEGGKATLSGSRAGMTPLVGTYARESKDGESPAVYAATFPIGEVGKDPPLTLRLHAPDATALGEQRYERQ